MCTHIVVYIPPKMRRHWTEEFIFQERGTHTIYATWVAQLMMFVDVLRLF